MGKSSTAHFADNVVVRTRWPDRPPILDNLQGRRRRPFFVVTCQFAEKVPLGNRDFKRLTFLLLNSRGFDRNRACQTGKAPCDDMQKRNARDSDDIESAKKRG